MASNIFSSADYQGILQRINSLKKDHPRQWGTMNLNQMLEHCSIQLKLGLGKIEQTDYEGPAIQQTWLGRWSFLYLIPWPKGLPTPSKMEMMKNNVPFGEFEAEKSHLIELLGEVQEKPNLKPHPFFGPLTKKDWGRLIWKHLDHHLKQFGE